VASVSERIAARIESVHDTISSAMASANLYSGSLQSASGNLSGAMGAEAMHAMAERLLTESRAMLAVNHQLEANLEAAHLDMVALQADLEDVRQQSVLDPLTMIYNRKHLDGTLLVALDDAQTGNSPLSLMMIDIDNFKSFNDTWGHQTGDQVLRLVAVALKNRLRDSDTLARFGGEEFAVVLPDTELEGGVHCANDLRLAIEAKELVRRSTKERLGRITASFGVATCWPGDTPASLIERADRSLYAAKEAGRNCVIGETGLYDSMVGRIRA
jgi:diguanylate cyclase